VVFFVNQQPITFAQLQKKPNSPTLARLRLDNQKNGKQGQIVSHHAIASDCCPIKALTARVLTLLRDGATLDTLICAYKHQPTAPFNHVTNEDIINAVCTAIVPSGAANAGYDPDLVGSHSLRSGGAMALFQQGIEAASIMKYGRWTSTSFLTYLHEQVDILSKGVAQKMSVDRPFVNLDVNPNLPSNSHRSPGPSTQQP